MTGMKLSGEIQLPVSAGLGSSASFSVCLAAALLTVSKQLAGSVGGEGQDNLDLDLVNRWAFMMEKIFHGSPSGIDNSVCTFGGAIAYKNGHIQPIKIGFLLKILAVNSMVQRNTKESVLAVKARKDKYPTIIIPILEAIDQIASNCVDILKNCTPEQEDFTYSDLGELIDMNQSLLSALNVSHPKIDDIIKIARKYRLHSKLTGAGRGGFVFILIKPDFPADSLEKMRHELCAEGFQCFNVEVGGKGLQIH